MSVTIKEVERIAQLAKLKITDDEKALFTEQFNRILNYIEKLNELDLKDVAPTLQVIEMKNVFREDVVKAWLSQEDALANAPKKKAGFFSVPKVIG